MTAADINNEKRLPILRKAVRDTGTSPDGMDEAALKRHLLIHHKVAPTAPAPKLAPTPPKAPAPPKAAPAPTPAPKVAPKTSPQPKAPNPASSGLPFGASKEFWDTVSASGQEFFNNVWSAFNAQGLRISACEDALAIANARGEVPTKAAPSQPADPYAPIRRFINDKEQIAMTDKDVSEASEEVLDCVLFASDVKVPEGTAVREKRAMVAELFGHALPTEAVQKGGKKAPSPAPQTYKLMDVVVADYDGQRYDPVQIVGIKGKRIALFFDSDQTVVDDGTAVIVGPSEQTMSNNWEDHKEDFTLFE